MSVTSGIAGSWSKNFQATTNMLKAPQNFLTSVKGGGEITKKVSSSININSKSSYQANLLKNHLRQAEEYGASHFRELANGKMRYYGNMIPAKKEGMMAGRRLVREWDYVSDLKRTWHETLDFQSNIRIVRPEYNDGNKIHYLFDNNKNFIGVY